MKLCSAEIDAVFTLSLLPAETGFYDDREALTEPNLYYYRRIWTYRKMQEAERDPLSSYYWESILFDLATLQARCVIRTRMQENKYSTERGVEFADQIIRRMIKERCW